MPSRPSRRAQSWLHNARSWWPMLLARPGQKANNKEAPLFSCCLSPFLFIFLVIYFGSMMERIPSSKSRAPWRASCAQLTADTLRRAQSCWCVYILIDTRRGPASISLSIFHRHYRDLFVIGHDSMSADSLPGRRPALYSSTLLLLLLRVTQTLWRATRRNVPCHECIIKLWSKKKEEITRRKKKW